MKIKGTIIPGHGVASGKNGDARYPSGTIAVQRPYFSERGLDLEPYFMGTVNMDIAPYSYGIKKPRYFFEQVKWSKHIPPENFYFFEVSLFYGEEVYSGLIYMPDPATKNEHEQGATTLELILPKISGIEYGQTAHIEVDPHQLQFSKYK